MMNIGKNRGMWTMETEWVIILTMITGLKDLGITTFQLEREMILPTDIRGGGIMREVLQEIGEVVQLGQIDMIEIV